MKAASETARGRGDWQGMNWLRQETRLAIYLRDGLACGFCGATDKLSADHVRPHVKGGTNHATNVVTCCVTCNSSKGAAGLVSFAKRVAAYRGRDAKHIVGHVRTLTVKPLAPFRAKAKELIAQYGSAAKAVAALNG